MIIDYTQIIINMYTFQSAAQHTDTLGMAVRNSRITMAKIPTQTNRIAAIIIAQSDQLLRKGRKTMYNSFSLNHIFKGNTDS